ncbi:MAG: arylsulfatase [Planctomycetales bacterium]
MLAASRSERRTVESRTRLPRRIIASLFIAISCLAFLLPTRRAVSAEKRSAPNIVVIMSDDMGFSDVGCYGGEINTPTLDRLAANGIRFTQFYNTARCCPTRAALLTGVYQHQAGIGLMTGDKKLPGYRGELGRDAATFAEAIKGGGYRAYMSGKWHVTRFTRPEGPTDNWPLQRGFDKFYGTIIGAGSFYDPATLCRGNTFITPVNDPDYKPKTYYYTDAISDNAVTFLKEHEKESPDKPLLLYVAYTCAHWPMHALPRDVAKYKGKYDGGFAPIREARLKRMKELGLVSADTKLSPQSDRWDAVADKPWEARNMEVYAAMIDSMDQGIGRITAELKRQGKLDDTLILFLQDNGGCAEGFGRYTPKRPYPTDLVPLGPDDFQKKIWPPMRTRDGRPLRTGPGVMAGPEDTFIGYGRGWANVSNTPFREYKHFAHEGGVSTPLIVHWPAGIDASRNGSLERQPGHVIDVMATCLDAAGVQYPARIGEHQLQPLEGVSLLPAFAGKSLQRKDAIYFEHHLNCAIRDGDWKLVRKGATGKDAKLYPWELYNMKTDRAELNDLAADQPDKVAELASKWEAWALRARVKPWPHNPQEVKR